MKLKDITSIKEQQQLDEILPALAMGAARLAAPVLAKGAMSLGKAAIGGVAKAGANLVGKAVGSAAGSAIGSAAPAIAGLAGGAMDPAQAAAAKKERDNQKKQVQDAIKAKQAELADLQKQLTQLG
jgi:hypothetical protein